MSKKQFNQTLITFADNADDGFPQFNSDKERLKYMKNAYRNMNLVKAFNIFYGLEISKSIQQNHDINNVSVIELGKVYSGTVNSFTNDSIVFYIPGIKNEIICKENFSGCVDEINNYLLSHDNKLLFEVREKKNDKYYVSVMNAYYKSWVNDVMNAVKNNQGINVHIDELVNGGYLGHTIITSLYNLTGKEYTQAVFIPGSHIVLNIELDFDKWIGQDVIIIPQKFADYKNYKTGEVGKSLVGSRKKVLQILGNYNLFEIYNNYNLAKNNDNVTWDNTFDGIVTGIINAQKKTGIFVEIKDKYITGLANVDVIDLVNYKPGDQIRVKISEFEVQEGYPPFVYNKHTNGNSNKIKECHVRPIFEII